MTLPTVSVVVPTHNHARFVGEAVTSALAQTCVPHEVIVVDDASTDHTSEVLVRFGLPVTVIRHSRNQGVAVARNTGAAASTGEVLAFLDADDAWLPAKLERQLDRLEREPDLGLVHCGFEEVDIHGGHLAFHRDGVEGWVSAELLLFSGVAVLGGGSGAVVPRGVFEDAGGFDTRLSTSADWDLYYRIAARRRVGFVDEILLRYRIHGGNMHTNVELMERDMLLAFAKAFSDPATAPVRRRAYANLHSALAGSYFVTGHRGQFVRHALRASAFSPRVIPRFLAFPARRARRWGPILGIDRHAGAGTLESDW